MLDADLAFWGCLASSNPVRTVRSGALDGVDDTLQHRLDVAAEQREHADDRDRDEDEDQRVLGEPLPFLLAEPILDPAEKLVHRSLLGTHPPGAFVDAADH